MLQFGKVVAGLMVISSLSVLGPQPARSECRPGEACAHCSGGCSPVGEWCNIYEDCHGMDEPCVAVMSATMCECLD